MSLFPALDNRTYESFWGMSPEFVKQRPILGDKYGFVEEASGACYRDYVSQVLGCPFALQLGENGFDLDL